jgi:hypothetical protein
MIEVSMVPTQHIDTCWEQIKPYMEKAAKYTYGRFTADDIYDSIVEHGYHLWVAFDEEIILGAVVTQFMVYPKRKTLSMTFCGGTHLHNWKDPMLALLQKFAADMSCDGIESTARKGWAKIFKSDGYKERWVTFELPVKGAENG